MKKILITGSTSGIGRETARELARLGHHVLVHGRSRDKVQHVVAELSASTTEEQVEGYVADLAKLDEVESLAAEVKEQHASLDVLIHNAGVFKTPNPRTSDGLDVRFVVNTIAPFLLTERLMDRLDSDARVINLSSAAQAPVDLEALAGRGQLDDSAAYAQSKLALTMWTRILAHRLGQDGPVVVAVNPGSLLATSMVQDAYGIPGKDVSIGSGILVRAALDDEFEDATGRYFDNDAGHFGSPHPDALSPAKAKAVVDAIEAILAGR